MPRTSPATHVVRAPTIPTLPAKGMVRALVVGIEEYQSREKDTLTKVDYAREDAKAFLEALQAIYGERLDFELIVDNNATQSTIKYRLLNFIQSLEADDLFVFYYAGHGFHGEGGNRITAWDTHPFHIEETTLLLREVLLDPLQRSTCRRALAFVDACASGFKPTVQSRTVITDFSKEELREYLAATEYFAMYLSCSPGQKSYPSDRLQHGIWTYFLLRALRGEAEEAIGSDRYLTDQSLKDYLRTAVKQYLTGETRRSGTQTPWAVINASGSFAIREVPVRRVLVDDAGDLSGVRITPQEEFFESADEGEIRSLPGFAKRVHFVPETHSVAADAFVGQRLKETIQEEIQDLYELVKEIFGLRSREVPHESDAGSGSVDTEFFRYTVDSRQHPRDPSMYRIVRRLELRDAADSARIEQIDEVFSDKFDKLVVRTSRDFVDFAELIDKLEELEAIYGGKVHDDSASERVTYAAPDGTVIVFSVAVGRISISKRGARSVRALLDTGRRYRFGLDGPSTLLLS
ncbi:caspase family protein [Paraburkholderia sediminicola]|uniref:caspase family protein n=1 Tax=Paraburkholderia sediminicola TaxID=458836 RepID=UPI0038BCDCDB